MIQRTIIHIDMNAFFASVEQRSNPRLRGKPVAVCGANRRTVIATASYEARSFGIKTGMNLYEAKKFCPELILVHGNNEKYTDTSVRIISILKEFTPKVEVFSIDEAFLDVSGSIKLFGSALSIAKLIKMRIKEELGLTCSIGIAPNKLLAKLASDRYKPDGLFEIMPCDVKDILEDLPVSELCGVGKKLEEHLAKMGIRTCGELGRFPKELLEKRFGVIGTLLHHMGRGEDDSPVISFENEADEKSIGHSMTFGRNTSDEAELRGYLLQLSEKVGRRLRAGRFLGRTVVLTVRYDNFLTFTKRKTGSEFINMGKDIFEKGWQIFKSIKHSRPIRLLGISVTSLVKGLFQFPLFDIDGEKKQRSVVEAMDVVNNRYGEFTLTWASIFYKPSYRTLISPSWRP